MDYLPVFLDLRGRSALVVGAGAVAARKISLLLEAGAVLRVVAPDCGAEVAALHDAGRVEYLAQEFTAQHLTGMVFAIAATDQPLVNREVARAGTAAGIWVNVVDDTDACTCIMPAIIDRSPVAHACAAPACADRGTAA
jgi:uroporphyrin-III C-methyltransferase/precorrin-2 dehydrogenase/sirohydrochlorin ferrochelatase